MANALPVTMQAGQLQQLPVGEQLLVRGGVDTDAAAALLLGPTTATSVTIGGAASAVTAVTIGKTLTDTTILGNLVVNESFSANVSVVSGTIDLGDNTADVISIGGGTTDVTLMRGLVGNGAFPDITFGAGEDHKIKTTGSAATVAGRALDILSGSGGAASGATPAGAGGAASLSAATGGAASITALGVSAAGGALSITSGAGGAGAASTNGGAVGGQISITGAAGGNGGAATGDGQGAAVVITSGASGTGGSAGARAGNLSIQLGSSSGGLVPAIGIGTNANATSIIIGTAGAGGNSTVLSHAEVPGSAGLASVTLNATAATAAGSHAIGVNITSLTVVPTNADLQAVLVALDAAITSSGNTLQQAYAAGNTIGVTSAKGSVAITNSADSTSALTVTRTFVGAGDALSISMGPAAEAVAGNAISITLGSASTAAANGIQVTATAGAAGTMYSAIDTAAAEVMAIEAAGTVTMGVDGGIGSATFVKATKGGSLEISATSTNSIIAGVASTGLVTVSAEEGAISITSTSTTAGGSITVTSGATAFGAAGAVTIGSVKLDGSKGDSGDVNVKSTTAGAGATGGNVFVWGAATNGIAGGVCVSANPGGGTPTAPASGQLLLESASEVQIDGFTVDINSAFGSVTVDAAAASNFTVSGVSADLTLGARAATITLNETGETTLDATFTATSIVGALNELKTGSSQSDITVAATANATTPITIGQLLAIDDAAGSSRAFQADANGAGEVTNPVGFAQAAAAISTAVNLVVAGEITLLDALWDVTPVAADAGKRVYMSTTAGGVTLTAPSTGGDVVMRVAVVSFADAGVNTTRIVVQMGEPTTL